MKLTEEEIEAGKSPKGGFTKAQLAEWGVPWPPPEGWKEKLLAGEHVPDPEADIDFKALCLRLILLMINNGQAKLLLDEPDPVLERILRTRLMPPTRRVVYSTQLPGAPF